MKILIKNDYEELSNKAALIIKEEIERGIKNLGLATGSTPVGCYKKIVRMVEEGELDLSQINIFNLDEYLGASWRDPFSYYQFMQKYLIEKIDVGEFSIPRGDTNSPDKEADKYERRIKEMGGIDLQILGLGRNGHIGFNEPSSSPESRTRVVNLSEKTVKDNSRFFDDEESVPKKAITMGIATILEAKKILLIASGKKKADICKEVVYGSIRPEIPASFLREHPNVTILLDKEAASKL